MSIWGKIIGGAAGFAVGGPLGALVGATAGHLFDRNKDLAERDKAQRDGGAAGPGFEHVMHQAREQVRATAFATATVVLCAKMAKADGHVSREEIAAFKRVFRIPPEQMSQVGKLFDEAKKSADGFEVYAKQIAT